MKRILLLIFLVICAAAMASAQGWGIHPWGNIQNFDWSRNRVETVNVSGSLIVAHGMPAVASGDVTYLISGMNRFIGFIDGLKEGAHITVEGSSVRSSGDEKLCWLWPAKLILDGKNYDLAMPWGSFVPNMRLQQDRQLPQAPFWNRNERPQPPAAPRQQRPSFPQRPNAPQRRR